MEKDRYYVHLENPVGFRKEILLCTKDMLHALKTHERYKQMRVEKEKKIDEFGETVKEIGRLNNKLKRIFPKSKLKKVLPKKTKQAKPLKSAEVSSKSKIKMIEEKLDKIEAKIKGLG